MDTKNKAKKKTSNISLLNYGLYYIQLCLKVAAVSKLHTKKCRNVGINR